jgi:hypothetical protein
MRKQKAQNDASAVQTLFYLIFDQTAQKDVPFGEVGLDEIEEIDQVRRMVSDVTDDPPQFLTST